MEDFERKQENNSQLYDTMQRMCRDVLRRCATVTHFIERDDNASIWQEIFYTVIVLPEEACRSIIRQIDAIHSLASAILNDVHHHLMTGTDGSRIFHDILLKVLEMDMTIDCIASGNSLPPMASHSLPPVPRNPSFERMSA